MFRTTLAFIFRTPLQTGIAGKFLDQGVSQLVIADTIGAANPRDVKNLMGGLVSDYGAERLACHFHDTRALGMANVLAALEAGIRRFDASIAGFWVVAPLRREQQAISPLKTWS